MTQNKIDSFRNKYFFLSNFYECTFIFNGIIWTSSEAAFQAQKDIDLDTQLKVSKMTPKLAKKACGKYGIPDLKINLRPDWEDVKNQIMYEVLKAKFGQNPELKDKLLSTIGIELEEGNEHHDNYWGNCKCDRCKNIVGKNELGKLLMLLRTEIKNNIEEFK